MFCASSSSGPRGLLARIWWINGFGFDHRALDPSAIASFNIALPLYLKSVLVTYDSRTTYPCHFDRLMTNIFIVLLKDKGILI